MRKFHILPKETEKYNLEKKPEQFTAGLSLFICSLSFLLEKFKNQTVTEPVTVVTPLEPFICFLKCV